MVWESRKIIKKGVLNTYETITKKAPVAKPAEEICHIGEFKIVAPISQSEKKLFVIISRLNVDYFLEIGESTSGNKTRLMNFFTKFCQQIEISQKRVQTLEEKRSALEGQLAYSSNITEKIEELEKELSAIFEQIKDRDDKQ